MLFEMVERSTDSDDEWGDWTEDGNILDRNRSRSAVRGGQGLQNPLTHVSQGWRQSWWSQSSDWWSQNSARSSAETSQEQWPWSRGSASSGEAAPSDSTEPVDERPRRHARGGNVNRPARQERNALYFFWQALKASRNSFMGIGQFRRRCRGG